MLDFPKISELPDPVKLSPPWSWAGHIPFAMWFVQQQKPETIVELGTHTGHSYFAFCQSIKDYNISTRCYAVDTWKGDHQAGYYGEEVYQDVRCHNNELYSNFSTLLRMTFDEARYNFSDASIDLLHIDGLHTYEAVKHDFTTWLPKLSRQGVILFHDITVRHGDFGVWKLWEELSAIYPHLAFDHSWGLGVLFTGDNPKPVILDLIDLWSNPLQQSLFKCLFAEAGSKMEHKRISTLKDQAIAEREHIIASRDFAIAERDHNHKLETNRLTTEIREKEQSIIEHKSALDRVIKELDDKTSWLHDQNVKITNLERELQAIKTSRSWKFIKPARKFSKSLHKRARKLKRMIAAEPVQPSEELESQDYLLWIQTFETCSQEKINLIELEIGSMDQPPLISVVMPVYEPTPAFLDAAINSVRQQVYPHWELCIADDCSPNGQIRKLITMHAEEDSRIRYVFRKENGHISAASNSAIELANGDYIALLDHDDMLHPLALYWNAKEIINHPDAALIYSDEDKIDENGIRTGPYFKSDFNYDLLLCQNMISHLGVYKTSIVKQIGGFRKGLEGSQDYDLVLRTLESIAPRQVRHIPKVLYHWRIHDQSTSLSVDAKPYALIAASAAIQEHLNRTGINAKVVEAIDAPVFSRIRYEHPQAEPLVNIVIVHQNNHSDTLRCISSLLEKTTYRNYILTLLAKRTDGKEIRKLMADFRNTERIKIELVTTGSGYASMTNHAAAKSCSDFLCLLNDNLEIVTEDWLTELVNHAMQPDIGAAGAKIVSKTGTLEHCGIIMGIGGIAGYPHKHQPNRTTGYVGRACLQQRFSALAGGCLVIRHKTFLEAGGMSKVMKNAEPALIDFTLKLTQAGLRNIWTPYAELLIHKDNGKHANGNPIHYNWTTQEIRYIQQRWKHMIEHDPAYNPNLSARNEDFRPAWPPRTCQ